MQREFGKGPESQEWVQREPGEIQERVMKGSKKVQTVSRRQKRIQGKSGEVKRESRQGPMRVRTGSRES